MSAAFTDAEVREQIISTIECFVDTSELEQVNDGAGPHLDRALDADGEPLLRVHVGERVFTVSVRAEDR
jgi:hypothetical protein